jgi:hypothetical protein
MGSPHTGQGNEVLLASVSGTPDAEHFVARFCIMVPQRAGDRLLLNMVDRRPTGIRLGLEYGEAARTAR